MSRLSTGRTSAWTATRILGRPRFPAVSLRGTGPILRSVSHYEPKRFYSQPPSNSPFSFKFGPQHGKGEALKEYSVDLTEMAREGKLDPTIGRDEGLNPTNDTNFIPPNKVEPSR
ncbi:p-loop containing nucleoside triphosphate hydrolase protein [Mycena venus]|uniref:p-loop containing nucleoside triphosphate hydrolase protein n=1 Tax=Mycena venus TaxID=2733690 RepID=A0A8H7D1Y1_9AGAR|nr:p-loop containing nucleoside triphosphate hydrolase protein [Mycena venus]